jgi:hypothetical protein
MGWAGVATCFSATAVAFVCRGTFAAPSATATHHEEDASHIYTEADEYELEAMRAEHTRFGRFLHESLEGFADDIQELVYVGQILTENQGLLILLLGGICSMMMALVAGLENVDVPKALFLSTALYGITTLLVARSARRIVIQNNHQGMPKLTKADVEKLMGGIPKEEYVPDADLDNCDVAIIKEMLTHREQKCCSYMYNSTTATQKEDIINKLRQTTRRSHDCCICMSSFIRGETIRILPMCHHEFHKTCIDQWACTFASENTRRLDAKRGNPTCPLCNACFAKK